MSYGIKVSKEGTSITSTAIEDFVTHSDYNALKIATEGAGTNNGTITIAHGMNFTPQFMAFMDLGTDTAFSLNKNANADSNSNNFTGYVNDTNLTLMTNAATNRSYYYYIFGDTVNEQSTQTTIPNKDTYVMRVSKAGKDVNSGYIEDYIFASDLPSLKIYSQGTAVLDATGGGVLGTVTHTLGFTPAFMVCAKKTTETKYLNTPFFVTDGRNLYAWSTSDALIVRAFPGLETAAYDFKYTIFANRGL